MSFEKENGMNVPGICQVEYVIAENVLIETDTEANTATLTLLNGASWQTIDLTNASASVKQKKGRKTAGIYFDISLALKIPKNRVEVARELEALDGYGLILRCTDKNGEVLILGLTENPMLMNDELQIPSNGYNGWTFNFSGQYDHRAYYQA